jgi:hypothetical protein
MHGTLRVYTAAFAKAILKLIGEINAADNTWQMPDL